MEIWDITSKHIEGRGMLRYQYLMVEIKKRKRGKKSERGIGQKNIEGIWQTPQPTQY